MLSFLTYPSFDGGDQESIGDDYKGRSLVEARDDNLKISMLYSTLFRKREYIEKSKSPSGLRT